MTQYPRYAIYYAPGIDTALHRFGSDVLGYDAHSGASVPFPADLAAIPDWTQQTEAPRKYGFHATLKAPFSLHAAFTEADLLTACMAFADQQRAIPIITPVVDVISGFTAIIPGEPSDKLKALAQDCVEAFDRFRAPMSDDDRARRNPAAMTERQIRQLDRWGYPYVQDDFRFHMTLTGRIARERQTEIITVLRNRFAALHLGHLPIDRIALFRQQEATARFVIMDQFGLTGTYGIAAGIVKDGTALV